MTRVINVTTGKVLARRLESAGTAWSQFKGLIGQTGLASDSGLDLPRTRGVHTHFMRFPIDVAFYDRSGVIVGLEHALRTWRFSAYHWHARGAIELPAGTLRAGGTLVGHALVFSESAADDDCNPPFTSG
jgi:uncharacterized membrane protein (UPF0127 family)